MFKYLNSCGVLEHGTPEDIADAKQEYKRMYKARWRKEKRKTEKEIVTSWSKEDLKELSKEAKRHHLSRTAFIKSSVFAYISKTYIVPDTTEVRRISQSLAFHYNTILEIVEESVIDRLEGKILLHKIADLERAILPLLHNPKTIDQLLIETLTRKPHLAPYFKKLVESYDTQKQ